jgi:hypothetical protein
MRGIIVTGRGFHVGAGALLLLATAQAAERSHKLEVVKGAVDFTLAKARETQAFKVGEILGLADEPKGQLHLIEELTGRLEKDSPAWKLKRAIAEMDAAAREAERKAEEQRQAEEKARAAEQARAAEAAQLAAWTDEWKATEAVRKDYPKVDDYVSARRKEQAKERASA